MGFLSLLPSIFPWSTTVSTLSEIKQRLNHVDQQINAISECSGVPGVSVGVVHQKEVIHIHNHGYSNVEKQQAIDRDTVFGIGSNTKPFIAAAIGCLVSQERLKWDTPVRDILPEFEQQNPIVAKLLTVGDILSHRSGLSGLGDMSLAFQGDGDMMLPKGDLFSLVKRFPSSAPFRTNWNYFVWGYSLAGEIIEKLSGKSVPDFLSESIFKPLKLDSTTFNPDSLKAGQLAEPYAGLSDGTSFHLPKRQAFYNTFFEASGGIYSSLNDMIDWSSAMLDAIQDDKKPEDSVIKEVESIISNHAVIDNPSLRDRSYGYGWVRTQLPGVVGVIGDNADLWDIKDAPVLGCKEHPLLMFYHQGSTVGYYSFVALFPDTNSAVVVLINSIALSDAADWIARAVIQALFNLNDGNDYVSLAKEANARAIKQYELLGNEIVKEQINCSSMSPAELGSFVGTYTSEEKPFTIEIVPHPEHEDRLSLRFQGLKDQTYDLRHHCDDTFEWSLTHDESKKRGRYNNAELSTYLFHFHVNEKGQATEFSWHNDPVVPGHKDVFVREDTYAQEESTTESEGALTPDEL
ncbi:hypothetical protein QQX98_007092 [Neonectria punicea]|uniref:Beta-lactamase-related domain-containing protein n=1 Tax=Neonectria punicea TaxID=979145 RepID=A0ABR1GYX1_9HYPO